MVRKALVVDDSSIMRKAITQYFQRLDIEVVGHASNGVIALELFKTLKPDIVTLDITMPEMNGLVCLDKIFEIDSEAKVIIVSVLRNEQMKQELIEKGACAFINKPINEHDFKVVVDKVIEGMI